jgi:hypothetical protein
MNGLFHVGITAGLLATPLVCAGQKAESAVLTVRVYNYAGTEKWILAGAQRQAANILRRAGATTNWIGCAVSATQHGGEPGCAKPLSGPEVVLKLLSHTMGRKTNQPATTFGFAVPTSPVGLGSVSIFVQRVEQLALSGPFSVGYDAARALVLGHVIVHEIGHLLLGPGSHSRAGIMSCPWSQAEIRQIAAAHLSFTETEALAIRERFAPGRHNP